MRPHLLSLRKCTRAQASLANPDVAASLLAALRETGTQAQAAQLIERLPAAGKFGLYRQEGRAEQFRFGQEADGRPAKLWDWTDPG